MYNKIKIKCYSLSNKMKTEGKSKLNTCMDTNIIKLMIFESIF